MASLSINAGVSKTQLDTLRGQGFPVVTNIEYEAPSIPSDITLVDDTELMEIFGKLTAYGTFLASQVACAEIDLKHLETAFKRKESALYVHYSETLPKATSTLVKAYMAQDEDLAHAEDEVLVKESYLTLIKQMRDNASSLASFTSRELSRRQSTHTLDSRSRRFMP